MKISKLILAIAALIFFGCSVHKDAKSPLIFKNNSIKVYAKITTDEFPKASLTLLTPDSIVAVGNNKFNYEVSDYSLKNQSPSAIINSLANSAKGQHIHFIVDNKPYQAKYEPNFNAELTPGPHLILAFLSRSFHESVKTEEAFSLKQYLLGDTQHLIANIDNDEMLFYSRPKGTYNLENSKKVLLDFYLVNTKLSKNGNKVRVILNGDSFNVDEWQPYIIEGLTVGEHTIQIELIDNKGIAIPGTYNNSDLRKFIIK